VSYHDYKKLLDALAVCLRIQNTEIMARASALSCASQIRELIERCERIEESNKPKELVAPF
jgi:hypothetical protein